MEVAPGCVGGTGATYTTFYFIFYIFFILRRLLGCGLWQGGGCACVGNTSQHHTQPTQPSYIFEWV